MPPRSKPRKNPKVQVVARATDDTFEHVEFLRTAWSGAAAQATESDVIREALRRAYEAEKKKQKTLSSAT